MDFEIWQKTISHEQLLPGFLKVGFISGMTGKKIVRLR